MPKSDFDFTLKRNCSISPQALLWLFAVLACVSLGIGLAFAAAGAWLVLPFAGMEMIALAAAFWLHARHVGDYERISASGARVLVEIRDGEHSRICSFERHSVRLAERPGSSCRLVVTGSGMEIEIGRHVDETLRRDLARALRRALHAECDANAVMARFEQHRRAQAFRTEDIGSLSSKKG